MNTVKSEIAVRKSKQEYLLKKIMKERMTIIDNFRKSTKKDLEKAAQFLMVIEEVHFKRAIDQFLDKCN